MAWSHALASDAVASVMKGAASGPGVEGRRVDVVGAGGGGDEWEQLAVAASKRNWAIEAGRRTDQVSHGVRSGSSSAVLPYFEASTGTLVDTPAPTMRSPVSAMCNVSVPSMSSFHTFVEESRSSMR
jgi:hypothetical protein